MMHRKSGRKLGVTTSHRKAMMANLCSSLVTHKRIETTLSRARELRRVADRMITLGKRGSLHARRQARKVLRSSRAVRIVFEELAPQFANRKGGYTRIMKLGYRRGDSSPMVVIEYLVGAAREERMPEKAETKGKKAIPSEPTAHKEKGKAKRKEVAGTSAAKKDIAETTSSKTKRVERGIRQKRERKAGRRKTKD